MLARVTQVLAEPSFAEVFGPRALAEVPLAATVEGQVVMGTADRLLVTADTVTVVDFKTARRPPLSPEAIPDAALKQMAAYVAALETIYPGRRVEAAVPAETRSVVSGRASSWVSERTMITPRAISIHRRTRDSLSGTVLMGCLQRRTARTRWRHHGPPGPAVPG